MVLLLNLWLHIWLDGRNTVLLFHCFKSRENNRCGFCSNYTQDCILGVVSHMWMQRGAIWLSLLKEYFFIIVTLFEHSMWLSIQFCHHDTNGFNDICFCMIIMERSIFHLLGGKKKEKKARDEICGLLYPHALNILFRLIFWTEFLCQNWLS